MLADQLVDLPDEMNGILRLCDGTRSLLAVVDDSDYPDLEALTVVSKLFGQGTIYAREIAGRHTEPSRELARWLEEGNAEDGVVAEEASAAQQSVTEAEVAGAGDVAASERQAASDDLRASGERQGGKTLKTFSLDPTMLSLDTPPPGCETSGATAELNKLAPSAKADEQHSENRRRSARPRRHPFIPGARCVADWRGDCRAASPLEVPAVVESSWREPANSSPTRTPPGGFAAVSDISATPRAGAFGTAGKPDTLRGFPIRMALPSRSKRTLRGSWQPAKMFAPRGRWSDSSPEHATPSHLRERARILRPNQPARPRAKLIGAAGSGW